MCWRGCKSRPRSPLRRGAVGSADASEALGAALLLALLGKQQGVDALTAMLQSDADSDALRRGLVAGIAIGELPVDAAQLARMAYDPDAEVRRLTARALSARSEAAVVPALKMLLEGGGEEDEETVFWAICGLARVGGAEHVGLIERRIRQGDPDEDVDRISAAAKSAVCAIQQRHQPVP